MMQGERGSLDMFRTLPPIAKARPDGVSSGWGGFCRVPRGVLGDDVVDGDLGYG